MALLSPFYLLAPPLLLLISIPLAFFAIITSILAFTTLSIRVAGVYVELARALITSYLFTEYTTKSTRRKGVQEYHGHSLKKSRRGSSVSFGSVDFAPPLKDYDPKNSESYASLLGAGVQGPARDYEGIGGWRDEAVDPAEEALWIGMNSRLELPAVVPERARRHHRRSYTGQSQMSSGSQVSLVNMASGGGRSGIWSPEALRMSPVQSRARTPSVTELRHMIEEEEYFGLQPHGSGVREVPMKSGMKGKSGNQGNEGKRRKSMSGDSISSLGSRKGSNGAVRLVG